MTQNTQKIGPGAAKVVKNGNGAVKTAQQYVPPAQPAKPQVFRAPDGREFATAEEALNHALTLNFARDRDLSLKVSEKGAVSVYGLGRFPVTLYREQMLKLLEMSDEIRTFIGKNESILKRKGESDEQYIARTGRVPKPKAE